MDMIRSRIRAAFPWNAPRRRKLVVACFSLPNKCWHHFNQLLGCRLAAEALGLAPTMLVPRTLGPNLAGPLMAKTVLDPLPEVVIADPHVMLDQLRDFVDAAYRLQSPWPEIEAEKLGQTDTILFHAPHAILVQSTGLWLARRPPRATPLGILTLPRQRTHRSPHGKNFRCRISLPLGKQGPRHAPGPKRVFFLANSQGVARIVSRVCDRRTLVTPLPMYYGDVSALPQPPDRSTVYLHCNFRSGQIAKDVSEIIRRVGAVDRAVRFLVKFSLGCYEGAGAGMIDDDIASAVEVVPAEQEVGDYFVNFAKCSLVVLAYQTEKHAVLDSGVFAIDAPRSPRALGLLEDPRLRRLGFLTLSISAAKANSKSTKQDARPVPPPAASTEDRSQRVTEDEEDSSD
ncbi:MAG: hypothetical protein JJE37_15895 [Methyloceanibacter sp.]|nr:hypothetical protein [Methyloceanibacter sp.]